MALASGPQPYEELVPRPDPTVLTTQQTERLRAEIQRELGSLREIIEARLDAMDKASVLLQANVTRVPTILDDQIRHLRELHEAKFEAIHHLLRERDARFDQEKHASDSAINAAFAAQEKLATANNNANAVAIGKSEVQMREQITALQGQIQSAIEATNDKIGNLTGRLDRGEAAQQGSVSFRSEQRLNIGHVWMIVGGIVGMIGLAVAAIVGIAALERQPVPNYAAPPASANLQVVPK